MKALIMAGGKGTRLYPYSATLPKPLMPIGNVPILEILLRKLRKSGITHVVLAVGHLRHLVEAFFGNGERFDIEISYSVEDSPLGTAGPIGNAIDFLGDTFLVANGDLLTTLNIADMIKNHNESAADITVGAYRRELQSDFGILEIDNDMHLLAYREKPIYTHLVSMGVYVVEAAAVRSHVGKDTHLDMPDLLRAVSKSHNVRCFLGDCFWLDIGRPDDFATAQQIYEKDPQTFSDQ
jgi:NDP-sugar pyrophosphorylase family protein